MKSLNQSIDRDRHEGNGYEDYGSDPMGLSYPLKKTFLVEFRIDEINSPVDGISETDICNCIWDTFGKDGYALYVFKEDK
jgi:hypothetical protein